MPTNKLAANVLKGAVGSGSLRPNIYMAIAYAMSVNSLNIQELGSRLSVRLLTGTFQQGTRAPYHLLSRCMHDFFVRARRAPSDYRDVFLSFPHLNILP
jgi:hypothetical protein